MSKKNSSWRTKFLKTYKFHKVYGFRAIFFETLQKISAELPKLHIMCWGNLLKKNSCFEQILNPELFPDYERKFFDRVFEKLPTFPEEIFHGTNISLEKSCRFRLHAAVSPWYLVKTFWQYVQNCISVVQRSMIPEKQLLLEKVDFFHIRNWSEFFSKALRKLFFSSVKGAIYMFRESFWRKNVLFFEFFRYLFFSFRDFDRDTFGTFRQKKTCQFCWKLHSTYPEDPFDENFSFQKLRIVQPNPDFEEEIPWFLFG